MRAHLVVFAAVAFSHLVLAINEPAPSFAERTIGEIIHVITRTVKASPHIIGGDEAVPHSYPHQVAIKVELKGRQRLICGGSLIAPEWVLTAAHCTHSQLPMLVHLGRHDLTIHESDIQVKRVANITRHDWNSETAVNDIALLKLETPVTLNEYVQPIRLPSIASKSREIKLGQPVVIIGWGWTSLTGKTHSPSLRFLQAETQPNKLCAKLTQRFIPKTMICAVKKAKNAWKGDSGGPLILAESDGQRTLIGIASFVSEQILQHSDRPDIANIFTRVDHYLEWIAKNTGITLRQK